MKFLLSSLQTVFVPILKSLSVPRVYRWWNCRNIGSEKQRCQALVNHSHYVISVPYLDFGDSPDTQLAHQYKSQRQLKMLNRLLVWQFYVTPITVDWCNHFVKGHWTQFNSWYKYCSKNNPLLPF